MSGDRQAIGKRQVSLLAIASLSSVMALTGCSDLRQLVGLDRVGPDEFTVESRAPLTIPPDFNLRPPQPGAARPQEANPADRVRAAVESAGPGAPGRQAGPGLTAPTVARSGPALDPTRQVGDQSLAAKLLGYNAGAGSTAVEKRETKTLEGVY
jgi:hypothetical protein